MIWYFKLRNVLVLHLLKVLYVFMVIIYSGSACMSLLYRQCQSQLRMFALCHLRRVMSPWFFCWFQHYIHCLLLYLASPIYFLFSSLIFLYLSTSLLTFSFENRPAPFPGWRSQEATKRGLKLIQFILSYSIFVFLCTVLHHSKFSYLH